MVTIESQRQCQIGKLARNHEGTTKERRRNNVIITRNMAHEINLRDARSISIKFIGYDKGYVPKFSEFTGTVC